MCEFGGSTRDSNVVVLARTWAGTGAGIAREARASAVLARGAVGARRRADARRPLARGARGARGAARRALGRAGRATHARSIDGASVACTQERKPA